MYQFRLIGPLPKTERGNCYIITLVDYFSKWPEAELIADKTARTVAEFLYKIICRQVYMNYSVTYWKCPAKSPFWIVFQVFKFFHFP